MGWQPESRDRWPEWAAPEEVTRESVERVLSLLANGRIHPEMAANWALQWNLDVVNDSVVLLGVSRLVASARRVSPTQYLFGGHDYVAWHDEYTAKLTEPEDRA